MTFRRTLWLGFGLFVLYGSLIPFHFATAGARVRQNLAPRVSIPDVVQNVLLFVPFGALGVLAARRRRPGVWRPVAGAVAAGALLSVAAEALQLFTVDRTSSFADVVASTAGTAAGAIGVVAASRAAASAFERLKAAGLVQPRAFYPLLVAVMLVCVGAWQPFDVTLDVSTVVGKARALVTDAWQFSVLQDEGTTFVRFGLLGAALYVWLGALGRRAAAFEALAAGVIISCGLEASQIAITSRMPGLEDALAGAAGVVAGTLAMTGTPLRRGVPAKPFLLLVILLIAVGAALQMLSPFTWAPPHRPIAWIPFYGYYAHTTFETLSHVVELLLIYFPLGFVLDWALGPSRRTGILVITLALAIAWPVEWAQGWVPGRYPDVTDVAMSLVGAWLGLEASRRGGPAFTLLVEGADKTSGL